VSIDKQYVINWTIPRNLTIHTSLNYNLMSLLLDRFTTFRLHLLINIDTDKNYGKAVGYIHGLGYR